MKRPKKLSSWDFSDTHQEPDGYDCKTVIDMTSRNIDTLVEEHNKLVEVLDALYEVQHRLEFED